MKTKETAISALLAPDREGALPKSLPASDEAWPDLDDHLVGPGTREEMLHGRRLWVAPAKEPHALQPMQLAYVLRAHVKAGYRSAVDLLIRTSLDSDFAPDANVYPEALDLSTGGHQLFELAFEVCSQQSLSVPTSKARELIRRGVRRVFCLLVEEEETEGTAVRRPPRRRRSPSRIRGWSRERDDWVALSEHTPLEDRCLARPLPLQALLVRGNRVFQAVRAEGEVRGRAEALIAFFSGRVV